MLNEQLLRITLENEKRNKVKERYAQPRDGKERKHFQGWTFPNKFNRDDRFKMRFLAPSRCRQGYRLWSVHKLEQDAGREPEKILCSESYAGRDEEGNLKEPCFLCELLEACADEEVWDELEEETKEALKMCYANQFLLFPMSCFCSETKITGDDGNDYTIFVPDADDERGVILVVSPDQGLLKDILKIFKASPDVGDVESGQYCTFCRKSNSVDISASGKTEPLKNRTLVDDKVFPDILQWGLKPYVPKPGQKPRDKKPATKVSYAKQKSMVRASWFMEDVLQHIEL